MPAKSDKLPEWVSGFFDRHSRFRLRFRRKGYPTHYFKASFGSREFWIEYDDCKNGRQPAIEIERDRATPGSMDLLISRFLAAPARLGPSETTQYKNRRILERFREAHGHRFVADFDFEVLDNILAPMAAATPTQARKLKRLLSRLFQFAVKLGMRDDNPMEMTEPLRIAKTKGYHTWTEAEIARFQVHHPLGTKARLALELMLWSGQRRGDAIDLGPSRVTDNRHKLRQRKTSTDMSLWIAPQLQAAIDAMPADQIGTDTYLVTAYGKPFSKAGFGNWFRDRCNEAGLPHCTAHGLRKAMARRLADNETSQQGLKAVGGWKGDAEVATYTRDADQQRLADAALMKLSATMANSQKKGSQ